MGIGIGIFSVVLGVVFLSLAKAAGMADSRLEEIHRLAREREAGVQNGN